MTDKIPENIPQVEAPVVVVAPKDAPAQVAPATVWDTQKIRKMVLEIAKMVSDDDADKAKESAPITEPKPPPYLLVILLMVLFGFIAVVSILTLRQDLDFVIVSGGVFLLVTTLTTSIFNIMKTNQTLQEAHEANVKSQLALVQTRETHSIVNSKLDEFKRAFVEAEQERSKVMAASAFMDGRKEGREIADQRTDKLAEDKKKEQ